MPKVTINKNSKWQDWVKLVVLILAGALLGVGVDIAVRPTDDTIEASTIELSQEQAEATIVTEDGEVIAVDVPTVENVDGGELSTVEVGDRGWYVRTDTPQHFVDDTYGQCIDMDGYYGSQCVDAANLFWQNYAGYSVTTCGYGSAKAMAYDDCRERNAQDKFTIIWDKTELQPGDWIITDAGTWGHVNMAMGYYNNGYITAYGTNQGGSPCDGGGSTSNIINFGLSHFVLAFRPNDYIVAPEPEPVIPISGCVEWHVVNGDTMTKIMAECEGFIEYGEIMNAYAKSWYSRIAVPGQSVYDGWHSESGIGLYAEDWIDHKF